MGKGRRRRWVGWCIESGEYGVCVRKGEKGMRQVCSLQPERDTIAVYLE